MKKRFFQLLILIFFLWSGFFSFTKMAQAIYTTTINPAYSGYNFRDVGGPFVSEEKFWFDGEHFRFSFIPTRSFYTSWGHYGDLIKKMNPYSVFLNTTYFYENGGGGGSGAYFVENINDLNGYQRGDGIYFLWEKDQRYDAYMVEGDILATGLRESNFFLNTWLKTYPSVKLRPEYSHADFKIRYDDNINHSHRRNYIDYSYTPEPAKPDPVIIIPGLFGSWKVKGEWKIDPILGTYNNLIEAFINAGYQTETILNGDPNLFVFPYDWRVDNNITANLLKDKIQEIKTLTGSHKVDIVAHSMGGLVARSYVQGSDYNNDVDQLIMIGTPHLGSTESYLTLIGKYFKGKVGILKEIYFTQEAIRMGYFDLTKYIQEQVPTVSQLLPTFSYLKDQDLNSNWQIRSYPDNYPRNVFLENLNRSDQLGLLKQRADITNIVSGEGVASASSTLRYIKVVPDKNISDNKWQYGYPINLDQGEESFVSSNGDGTVPYESANYLEGVKSITLSSDKHSDLPTIMQQYIIEILTGKKPAAYFDSALAYNFTRWSIFRVYSPVDFVVIAPDGKRVGKDFINNTAINEINNAFYTGFDDHTEFVMIPNPQDGEYRVELQGVDDGGEYSLVSSFIDENNLHLNKDLEVKSVILSGAIDSFKINYNYNNPDVTTIESEVDFKKLIDLVNYLHSNNLISKKNVYNLLVVNLIELSHKYDKILNKELKHDLEDDDHKYVTEKRESDYERELNKHDDYDDKKKEGNKYHGIKKQLEDMTEKIEFYYDKHWITNQAKNVLISNINLLIKKI